MAVKFSHISAYKNFFYRKSYVIGVIRQVIIVDVGKKSRKFAAIMHDDEAGADNNDEVMCVAFYCASLLKCCWKFITCDRKES